MRKLLLLALLLTACSVPPTAPEPPAPPPAGPPTIVIPDRDHGQWTTTTHGVTVHWRAVTPDGLNSQEGVTRYVGMAYAVDGSPSCVAEMDLTNSRHGLARVAAHEYAHCAQRAYTLPGRPRPDLGSYYATPDEGFAETYARRYVALCSDSLRPLGWQDYAVPTCEAAPDPRTETP